MSCASAADGSPQPAIDALPPRALPTLVLGLGNPMLGDDGVGWAVVERLERRLADDTGPADGTGTPVELDRLATGGLGLMERLVDHDRAILIDAVRSGRDAPGTITCGPLESYSVGAPGHLDSVHDASLASALAAGRALGARLPVDIEIVGIEALRVDEFGEAFSPQVAEAVPRAVDVVLALLAR
jgi:hydrogenase maturation protease